MAKNSANNVVDTLEDFFKKAPALPANLREGIVNVAPWLVLIFGILGVLGALSAVGVLTAIAPLSVFSGAAGVASYGGTVVASWIWLAASVLVLASYPGVKARKLSGWNLLFWSVVVNTVGSVVSGELVSAVLGALIGFYILFQLKSYYK